MNNQTPLRTTDVELINCNSERDDEILRLQKEKLSHREIAWKLDISPITVGKVLKQKGVVKAKKRPKPTPEIEAKVIELHRSGVSTSRMRRELKMAKETIDKIIDKHGRSEPCKPGYPAEIINKVVELHDSKWSQRRIGMELGLSRFAVSEILVNAGKHSVARKKKVSTARVQVSSNKHSKPRVLRSALVDSCFNKASGHLRILEIRHALDLTRPEYARALGINKETIASYELGITKTVPKSVIEKAEYLLVEEAEFLERRKYFDQRGMPEIIDTWAKSVGVDPFDLLTLADLANTTTSTIRRWLSGRHRPSVRQMIAYERQINLNASTS